MMKFWRSLNHAGMALFVFVTLTGVFLWRTGSLRLSLVPARAASQTPGAQPDQGAKEARPGEAGGAAQSKEPGVAMCAEHGVPEAACTRCNPALIAAFKAKGDWCAEHNLPESQCTLCNPDAKKAAASKAPAPKAEEKKPAPPKAEEPKAVAMCAEHGVPKDACTRCNPALIAAFKAKGDWCAGHNLPESQCTICNPDLKKAPAPKAEEKKPAPPKAEEPKTVAMCAEHGVPEAACTRCNPALIAAFKAKGDWCSGHNVPESQCVVCNPDLKKAPPAPSVPSAPFVPWIPSLPSSPDLSALEKRTCNHGKRTLDCDSCRFELGVVKVQPAVAKSLLEPTKVERRETAGEIRLTGEVQLDQTRVVDVPPPAAGRVLKVLARLGQPVKEGDPLAVIHSGDLGEAKAKCLEAATQLEIARKEQERQAAVSAALERLAEKLAKEDGSAGASPSQAGQKNEGAPQHARVAREGEAPAEPRGKPTELIGEGRSKLVSAASKLTRAKSAYAREKELWEKQASSKADFEAARQELDSAQAEYTALIEEAYLNRTLDKLRADTAVRKAAGDLNAARERLHIFGLDHATIEALREQKDDANFAWLEVKAPRPGTIIAQNAAAGRSVETSQTLYTIADLSNLWVWCDLYERDLEAVHTHLAAGKPLEAIVRVAAFRDTAFPGTLDLLGSTLDERTRTVKARVQVPNPQGKLRPGMFATVEVRVPSNGPSACVPADAIVTDAGKSFVFQHWRDDLWVRCDVVLGQTHDRMVEVAGVPEGALVASGGAFLLKGDILRGKMGAG